MSTTSKSSVASRPSKVSRHTSIMKRHLYEPTDVEHGVQANLKSHSNTPIECVHGGISKKTRRHTPPPNMSSSKASPLSPQPRLTKSNNRNPSNPKKNVKPPNVQTEPTQFSSSPTHLDMQLDVFDAALERELDILALPILEKHVESLKEKQSTTVDVPFDVFDDELTRELHTLAFKTILKRLETLKKELLRSTDETTMENGSTPPMSPSGSDYRSTASSSMFPKF